jgi:spore germination protein KC
LKPRFFFRCIIMAVILISMIVLMTGCFDLTEIDELAYPMAMGLDIGEADRLRLTLQLASPLTIGAGGGGESGGGGGNQGGEASSIITVDTTSIYQGLNLINNIISKKISMSHAQVIVISRRLAEQGGSEKYLHAIQRGRQFRPDVFIMISENPPDEYFRNVKHTLESSPAKYYELMLGNNYTSLYPHIRMHEFYYKNKSDAVQPVAVLTGLGKYSSIDQLKNYNKAEKSGSLREEAEYAAGNIPIVSEQKNEVMGAAVFKNGKMVGTLNGKESEYFQMITGKYTYSYITIPDPQDEKYVIVLNIFRRKKPVIKAKLIDGKVKVSVLIDLEGNFTSIQSGINYENKPEIIEMRAEEILESDILNLLEKTRDDFDSDICGIGFYVMRKFKTWDSWKRFNWFEQFKNTDFEVDVNLKMRRTGLMIKSADTSLYDSVNDMGR